MSRDLVRRAELLLLTPIMLIARAEPGARSRQQAAVTTFMIDALRAAGIFDQPDADSWRASVAFLLSVGQGTGEKRRGRLADRDLRARAVAAAMSDLEAHAAVEALRYVGLLGAETPDGVQKQSHSTMSQAIGAKSIRHQTTVRASQEPAAGPPQTAPKGEPHPPTLGATRRIIAVPPQRIAGLQFTTVELAERGVVLHWHYVPGEDATARERGMGATAKTASDILHRLALADDIGTAYKSLPYGAAAIGPPGSPEETADAWTGVGIFTPEVPEQASVLELHFGTRATRLALCR